MSAPLSTPAFWADVHRDAMLAACLRFGLTLSEAEDAVQDAMIRLIGVTIQSGGNPRSYAVRAAVRKAIDVLRQRGRCRTVSYIEAHDRAPEEVREMDPEYAERVRRAVDEAPARFGEAIRLSAEGLTYDEIAVATGVAVGTVRSRIHRGRKILAPLLSAA